MGYPRRKPFPRSTTPRIYHYPAALYHRAAAREALCDGLIGALAL
jgi:hypothetical protein